VDCNYLDSGQDTNPSETITMKTLVESGLQRIATIFFTSDVTVKTLIERELQRIADPAPEEMRDVTITTLMERGLQPYNEVILFSYSNHCNYQSFKYKDYNRLNHVNGLAG